MDHAAFRASLVRIGFSSPASVYIVALAGQGILFEDLVDLLADEDVSTLCLALCRPADGMINDATGNPIHNPGIPVSALAEIPLKIAIYLARLFSCPCINCTSYDHRIGDSNGGTNSHGGQRRSQEEPK